MSASPVTHQKIAIQPFECVKTAWNVIRSQYWMFFGVCAVGMLIGSVAPLGILLGPMMCGIYLCYLSKWRNERPTFDMLFKGFDYFLPSLVATLILVGIMMVVFVPMYILLIVSAILIDEEPDVGVPMLICSIIGMLAVMVVSMVLGVLCMFSYLLIVDRGLDGMTALKASTRGPWDNLWGVLGLALVHMLLGLVGVLACYFGAFFLMPVTIGSTVIAYRKIFLPATGFPVAPDTPAFPVGLAAGQSAEPPASPPGSAQAPRTEGEPPA